jgi:hypothetical protein
MKILFNLLLFIPLLAELGRVFSPVVSCEMGKRFRAARKENPEGYVQDTLDGPDGSTLKFYFMAYLVILLGLLSSQWVIFLVYIVFDVICNKLRLQRIAFGVFTNALVGSIIILFAMINGVHLHYNIYNIVISMF